MEITCNKCKHVWEYKGPKKYSKDYPVYTSCGRCHYSVKLVEEVKKE